MKKVENIDITWNLISKKITSSLQLNPSFFVVLRTQTVTCLSDILKLLVHLS